MRRIISACAIVGACVAAVGVPFVIRAAAYGNAATSEAFQDVYSLRADASGQVSVDISLPGVTLQSFLDSDTGTPELVDVLVDPTDRRYAFLSVRLVRATQAGPMPFMAKLYRFDFETGKIIRIYRDDSQGLRFMGFDGARLLVTPAPYGDNSPGPCWIEEELASNEISFIDSVHPWLGIQKYSPSKSFRALRATAMEQCSNS